MLPFNITTIITATNRDLILDVVSDEHVSLTGVSEQLAVAFLTEQARSMGSFDMHYNPLFPRYVVGYPTTGKLTGVCVPQGDSGLWDAHQNVGG